MFKVESVHTHAQAYVEQISAIQIVGAHFFCWRRNLHGCYIESYSPIQRTLFLSCLLHDWTERPIPSCWDWW